MVTIHRSLIILFFLSLMALVVSCKNETQQSGFPVIAFQHSETSGMEKKLAISQESLQKSMERGQLIYQDFCMQCHLPSGEGVPNSFPPLAGSDWLISKREASLRAVKFGQQGAITVNGKPYNGVMVPMGLSETEIADVMNYVMNSWGNAQDQMVTPEEVAAIKKNPGGGSN